MAAFDLFFRVIDRFVDGDVAIVQGRKHKYTIPACFKDLYWPRYDEPTHGKYEAYRDVEHLVAQARCAMEQEDIRNLLSFCRTQQTEWSEYRFCALWNNCRRETSGLRIQPHIIQTSSKVGQKSHDVYENLCMAHGRNCAYSNR